MTETIPVPTTHDILNDVLDLNREIEERQEEINRLYKKAKDIISNGDIDEDDLDYFDCIKSYKL